MPQKDKFGLHECLDRSSVIMDMVDNLLLGHEALTEEEQLAALKIHGDLFKLYQDIGARHLGG